MKLSLGTHLRGLFISLVLVQLPLHARFACDTELIEDVLTKGLRSRPPSSFPYLRLVIEHNLGAPGRAVDVRTTVVHKHSRNEWAAAVTQPFDNRISVFGLSLECQLPRPGVGRILSASWHSGSRAVGIRQMQALPAELATEEAVFVDEVRDHLPFPTVAPASQHAQHQVQGRQIEHEAESISRERRNTSAELWNSTGRPWIDSRAGHQNWKLAICEPDEQLTMCIGPWPLHLPEIDVLVGRGTAFYGRRRTGMSPAPPHDSTEPIIVLELLMYHVPVDGRKTAMSVLPSPSESAAGMSAPPPQL